MFLQLKLYGIEIKQDELICLVYFKHKRYAFITYFTVTDNRYCNSSAG